MACLEVRQEVVSVPDEVEGILLTNELAFGAGEGMRRLGELKIGTRPFFGRMHEQRVFIRMALFAGERQPVGERLARRGFYMPRGLALTEERIYDVAEGVKWVIK